MSNEIYRHDRYRLDRIVEQIRALSDVVDELRTEVDDLWKISLNANREDASFASTEISNRVDRVRPSALRKIRTYFRNISGLTATRKICRRANGSQRNSTIYDRLKSVKGRIIKTIQSVSAVPQGSLRSTEERCVTFSPRQQNGPSREEETRLFKLAKRNESDVSKRTETSEESADSRDTSFVSDASAAQVFSRREDKREDLDRLPRRRATESSVQASPSSMTDDDSPVVQSDRFVDDLPAESRATRTIPGDRFKKCKQCTCGGRCSYALYELSCDKCKRPPTQERKADDKSGGGLTRERLSFGGRNDFPKFINVNATREDYELSITSSHSTDPGGLNDYDNAANGGKFSKRGRIKAPRRQRVVREGRRFN